MTTSTLKVTTPTEDGDVVYEISISHSSEDKVKQAIYLIRQSIMAELVGIFGVPMDAAKKSSGCGCNGS